MGGFFTAAKNDGPRRDAKKSIFPAATTYFIIDRFPQAQSKFL